MATTDEVICDAGPLIHMDELSALDLLVDFSAVFVPQAVWAEVVHHRPEALNNAGVQAIAERFPEKSVYAGPSSSEELQLVAWNRLSLASIKWKIRIRPRSFLRITAPFPDPTAAS